MGGGNREVGQGGLRILKGGDTCELIIMGLVEEAEGGWSDGGAFKGPYLCLLQCLFVALRQNQNSVL